MPEGKKRATPSLSITSFAVFLFLKLAPEDLAGSRARQLVHELDDARHLEGRHSPTRPFGDRLRVSLVLVFLFQDDQGLDRLAAVGIARTDYAGLLDRGMRVEHRFHFGGPDLEPGAVDHPLQPVGDEEIALLVVVAEVAGAEEAFSVVHEEDLRARLGLLPVAAEHLGAVDDDFSDLIRT